VAKVVDLDNRHPRSGAPSVSQKTQSAPCPLATVWARCSTTAQTCSNSWLDVAPSQHNHKEMGVLTSRHTSQMLALGVTWPWTRFYELLHTSHAE
jgi:hypothetical protein